MKTTLSKRIEFLLGDLGIKQQDFAQEIDFTQSYISQILNGNKVNPTSRFLEAVCRKFNVNSKWLREGKGDVYKIEGEELPSQDAQIIAKYRLLSNADQKVVAEIINAFLLKNMTSKD